MKSTTMTLRVPLDMKDSLDKLAAATQRTRSSLGCEAIRRYLELESRQPAGAGQAAPVAGESDFTPAKRQSLTPR